MTAMRLVQGYGSSSESESEVKEFQGNHADKGLALKENSNSLVIGEDIGIKRKLKSTKAEAKKRKLLRKGKGPWGSWSGSESSTSGEEAENQEVSQYFETDEPDVPNETHVESSTFYGESKKDYQNRGFLHPPAEVGVDFTKNLLSFKCYLPKKTIHVYSGHLNGTGALRFFPNSGHLFLSGGNDCMLRIWDFYHDRSCLRDYKGHSKPIKAVDFANDGRTFLSAAFDQKAKIWDTETGKVTSRYNFHSTPNDLKFHPTEPNSFIVGLSNSKINHYDVRVQAKQGLVQVYDHHLSSISSLRFFPDGSKFISSSEDKTVRIWENQINIPIKQISDTAQHSMPYIDVHPQHHYFCTQSMDNTIYTYGMQPKYKRHPNKSFKGHQSAGYGIGFTFSPDGHYICSGDAKSNVMIWDWTTTKLLKTIRISGGKPITQVAWNPQETSKVICTGGVGKIFLLD